MLPGMSTKGVSTVVANKQAAEYEYVDTRFAARESTSSLKMEYDKHRFSLTDCGAYGSTSFSAADQNEDECSFSQNAAYGDVKKLPATEEETYEYLN